MEPLIPDWAYCLFRRPVLHLRDGMILLAQHRDVIGPDTGGQYTVKRYRRVQVEADDGSRELGARLEPENPEYLPIEISPESTDEFQPIAEFITVVDQDEPEPMGQ